MKKLIIILIIPIITISYVVIITSNNNNYLKNTTENLQKSLSLNSIKSYNYYNYTYTIITGDEIIIVNDKYEVITRFKKDEIKDNNCHLIYKNNTLVCEKKEQQNNTITYNYYDAHTDKLLSSITIKEGL